MPMGDKRSKIVFIYLGKGRGYLKARIFNKRKEEDPDRIVPLAKVKEPLPGYTVLKLEDLEAAVREKIERL